MFPFMGLVHGGNLWFCVEVVDRFHGNHNSILVATDGFARGMYFDNVGTVIHYQLPHSTDIGLYPQKWKNNT
jgi:hypothetical protein